MSAHLQRQLLWVCNITPAVQRLTKFDVVEHPHHDQAPRPDVTGSDGFLMDIDVQDTVQKPNHKDRSHDVNHFFTPMYKAE